MHKTFFKWAALLGAIAVAAGAFGAHALRQIVPEQTVGTFDTGVRYQMYHVLALLFAGLRAERFPSRWIRYSGNAFIIGIILFSGSLYLLTLLKATADTGLQGLGLITPIGGVFLIAGWLLLARSFFGPGQ